MCQVDAHLSKMVKRSEEELDAAKRRVKVEIERSNKMEEEVKNTQKQVLISCTEIIILLPDEASM